MVDPADGVHWDVNGVSLNTYCQNVEELTGKFGAPSLRGDNIKVAYRRGDLWRPKVPDNRQIQLGMWISSRDEDGLVPAIGRERQLTKNLHALQRLVYTGGRRQLDLTKRWRDPLTGSVVAVTAKAELLRGLAPGMETGAIASRVVVEFELNDPYYYTDEIISTCALSTPEVINNPGNDYIVDGVIRLNGPLENPVLTNSTPETPVSVTFADTIAGGAYVDLDLTAFSAKTNLGVNVLDKVSHDGARAWMELGLDDNTLTLTADSGSGDAVFTYRVPYL